MNNLVLQKNYPIPYSCMNCDLTLKPYSLLNYLQDIASESAQQLGFGYTYMSQNNYAWFLIKYRMEFSDYPKNLYDITFKTQPRGYNKLFAYRSFEILENEKVLGNVFSMWSVVDLNTRTTIPVQNAIQNSNMPKYEKKEEDLAFSKIKPLEKIDNKKEFLVRFNDLDVNGHANNGNYIVWAFEALPKDFILNHKIKTLDLMFKKEAVYDETVVSAVEYKENNVTSHVIKNKNDEDLCLIECQWE